MLHTAIMQTTLCLNISDTVCPQTQVLRESPEVCEDQMLVDARWGSDSKTQESLVTHPDFKDLFPHRAPPSAKTYYSTNPGMT